MYKLGFEETKELEIKLPIFVGSWRKQRNSRKTSSTSLATLKPLTVWFTTKWKILQEMEIPDHLTCFLRNLYAGQEATVITGHGTTNRFKIGKEYVKAVYCQSAYLTSIQGTSCKIPGWMKYKLESRLLGEITSAVQMTPPLWQEVKRN